MMSRLAVRAVASCAVVAGTFVAVGHAAAAAPWHLLADVSCHGNTSIWSMDPDGGHKQLYLADAAFPAISPDNTTIAYATAAGVYVAPVNGAGSATLVAPGDTYPSWSPDGTQLAVQHGTGSGTDIRTVTVATGAIVDVPNTAGLSEPAWGSAADPDGNRFGLIAGFDPSLPGSGASSLVGVRPDGSAGPALGYAGQSASNPSWARDGTLIMADSGGALQTGSPGSYDTPSELPTQPGSQSSASRPDGTQLAYATASYGTGDLYLYQQDAPVWDWTDVPAYWATEFGGTAQSDCGVVAHPTWYQGTLGAPDTTAPTVSCAAADTGWHAGDVTIACTAQDTGSGLASSGDASFGLSTTVPAGTATATASTTSRVVCDVAGNCTTAGPVTGIKVDKAAPAVSITSPVNGAAVAQGSALTASYSCTDAGSGVASCAGSVASGAALDTSVPGVHTFTVNGRDAVGNAASATASYTVTPAGPSTGPTISIADAAAREGNTPIGNVLLFRITLSKAATAAVRVTATARPGTATTPGDYLAVPISYTLRPGQTFTLYPVLIRGDRVVEPDETLTVALSGASGATIARGVATGTIINDDR